MFPPSIAGSNSIQFMDSDVANHEHDYEMTVAEAEALCSVVDPETTPYVSKYKARDMVFALSQKLEAYSVVARAQTPSEPGKRSEKKKSIDAMLSKVASLRVRSGIISYDCDEPHTTERDLDHASDILFPSFVTLVQSNLQSDEVIETDPSALDTPKFDASWYPPDVVINNKSDSVVAMKCLNMMGILWAGRGDVKKSFLYLYAAKNLYHDINSSQWQQADTDGDSWQPTQKESEELESLFTHNLFYLAQSFGHISDLETSSKYCHETLRRQLAAGFDSKDAAFSWAKNCASMSNFYSTMELYQRCNLALLAAELVLREHVSKALNEESAPKNSNDAQLKSDASELQADIHRKLAHLDILLLKKAFEREVARNDWVDRGLDLAELDLSPFQNIDLKEKMYEDYNEALNKKMTIKTKKDLSLDSIDISLNQLAERETPIHQSLFPQLHLPDVSMYAPRLIVTFEDARKVFLRAVTHLEVAKEYFVLDGKKKRIK